MGSDIHVVTQRMWTSSQGKGGWRKGQSRQRTRTGNYRQIQQAMQDAKPLQLGACWLLRHLPGSADNYRWFWEKGKVHVSMDSCEEGDHVGNVKDTSANIHLVLGLV